MLIFLYVGIVSIYLAGTGFLIYHFIRIKEISPVLAGQPDQLMISVVIVVRNEEENIRDLLHDLACQSTGMAALEVLVVNDHSTDRSCGYVKEMMRQVSYPLKLLQLSSETGKKAGLELGIKNASGKIIAVTDGDCRVPPDWLRVLIYAFSEKRAVFISGPVTYSGERTFFEKLQTIEFASLVGSGAALLHAGYPGMCNAANMAFSGEAFKEAGGFSSNRHIPSGDDEFLLQALFKRYPEQVFYLKSKNAVVRTKAQPGPEAFFYQRKRWAGKWRLHKSPSVALTAAGLYLYYVLWLSLFLVVLVSHSWTGSVTAVLYGDSWPMIYFFAATLLKFAAEFLFLQIIMRSLGKKLLLMPFLTLLFLYPFYVLFFGVAVNFGSFSWKGRTYKYTNT